MEGKSMILKCFHSNLALAQIQVEANICCPTMDAKEMYYKCITSLEIEELCSLISGCRPWDTCPPGWINAIFENSGNAVFEYCKLGCTSYVCGAMAKLQKFDTCKLVNGAGAVKKWTKACSTLCTRGTKFAVEAAKTSISTKIPQLCFRNASCFQ